MVRKGLGQFMSESNVKLDPLDLQDFGVGACLEFARIHRHCQHAVIPNGAGQLDEPVIAEPPLQ